MFDKLLESIEDETLRASLKQAFEEASSKDGYVLESELDRRVNAVSQKHITDEKKLRAKILKEIEDEATLNAEEKANKILEDAKEMQKAVSIRENKLNAMEKCLSAGISKDVVNDTMLKMLVTSDAEVTDANIQGFIDTYNAIQNKVKNDVMDSTPQPKHNGDGTVTKKDFDAMSTDEQIKFKTDHPETFKKFVDGR